jgi:hypothetical protein
LKTFVWFQLARLSDFFKSDDVFFAYGSERVLPDDFELDVEGKCEFIISQFLLSIILFNIIIYIYEK